VDPLGWLAALLGAVTLLDLQRRIRRGPASVSQWLRVGSALVGCCGMWWSTSSPFAIAAMASLPRHMIVHVVLMFLVPMALVYGGVTRRWWFLVPVAPRRRILRLVSRYQRLARRNTILWASLAAVFMNFVMVAAHLPIIFNRVMMSDNLRGWLLEPMFLLSGYLFFSFLVTSPPRKVRVKIRIQIIMVLVTMAEMLILAMSMSIFTKTSWYTLPMSGMTDMGSVMPFHDQQSGAAILWICGDVWAVPLLVVIVRRIVEREGSLLTALDAFGQRRSRN